MNKIISGNCRCDYIASDSRFFKVLLKEFHETMCRNSYRKSLQHISKFLIIKESISYSKKKYHSIGNCVISKKVEVGEKNRPMMEKSQENSLSRSFL